MRETNFLVENNAKPIWHPMAHPAEMRAHPPKIIMQGRGRSGHRYRRPHACSMPSAAFGTSISAIVATRSKRRSPISSTTLPYYSGFRGTSTGARDRARIRADGMVRAGRHGARLLHLGRIGFGRDGAAARAAILEDQGPRRPHQVSRPEEGLSRHAFRRRIGQWQRQFPPQLRAAAARRLSHPRPWTYRNPFDETRSGGACAALRRALEDEIAFQGADTIAAFIMEPVLGAGGVIVPHESFMTLVRDICDKHGILLIADEVVTAFGRTGAWSGSRPRASSPT